MHVRFSFARGLPVTEEGTEEVIGKIAGILLHPDTGKVEGFFVAAPRFVGSEDLFLGSSDVLRWGARVHVRSRDVLGDIGDCVRLAAFRGDDRTVLGQRIRTEGGIRLGRCRDIQFNTDAMRLEWIFPRKCFRWGVALPVSEIKEVKRDAIVVRDPAIEEKAPVEAAVGKASFPGIAVKLPDASVEGYVVKNPPCR